ncbi:MAG: MFS transporter [SAR324 cluster bacterium]|nr:MFS transporter [SAR324 cluster bacterium]
MLDTFRGREGRAWLIVFASATIIGMGIGSLFSISVFLKPLAAEFGWARGDTALAYTFATLLNGLGGILMGYLADRYAPRPIVIGGAVLLGASLLMLGRINALWQLYLLFGPFVGLALSTFLAPLIANVGFWFERNHGMAIGTVMAGQSVGGALVPLVARYLISEIGWREAFMVMGIGFWLIVIPLTLLIQAAPGAAQAKAISRRAGGVGGAPGNSIAPGRLAMVLSAAIVLCCVCMSIPIIHQVSLLTDAGISARTAASVMGFMMLCSVIGRVGVGKVADYIGGIRSLLLFSCIQTAFTFWFTQTQSLPGLYAIALLFGLGYGGIIPAYAIILREHMPLHRIGSSVGTVFFFGNVGMGLGGYLGGLLFDLSGSYLLPFAVGTASGVCNMLVVGSLLYYLSGRRPMLQFSAERV